MRKTNKLLTVLVGTILAGQLAGCTPDQTALQPPPNIEGYDNRYWQWDEQDQEWEYNPPGGEDVQGFYYGGGFHKSSIKNNPLFKSGSSSSKSGILSKIGGFGSGSRGGFGG